jgi:hypothetical protein
MKRQPWIGSAWFDGAFILGPALLATALVLTFRDFVASHPMPPAIWVVLVVGVDVSHVYSTLYRTYFDTAEFARRRTLYVLAPLLGWLCFACLYSLGDMVFWRGLAYLAVFHFVRQQYGFMMIYGRLESGGRTIDKIAIYSATLLPLIWWHTHPRHFQWFVEGDFFSVPAPWMGGAVLATYAIVMLVYVLKEIHLSRKLGVNWPRNLLLAGTALSWWVGIVELDSDLAFTALNVLAHGIPYIALVWLYGRTRWRLMPAGRFRRLYQVWTLPLFLALPLLLAYLEEGAWDGFVWRDHTAIFSAFAALPMIEDPDILTWLVPLLALPQITHYVLDAVIWRVHGQSDPTLRSMLSSHKSQEPAGAWVQ